MKLDFQTAHGRTAMRVVQAEPPWKVVRAFNPGDGSALVHLNNVSGGILSGDDLRLHLEVGPAANAQVTSTGATRIYRGTGANQFTSARVAGLLEYLPDAVIPFAGSRYRQTAEVDLEPGGGLFWWEVVAPGREASGELFAYDSLYMEMKIRTEGRPLAVERFELAGRPWLEPHTHFASFYICRAAVVDWLELEAALRNVAMQPVCAGARWGVSALARHGLLIRGTAMRSRFLFAGLNAFWKAAKLAIDGREARPPRKLY